MASWSELGGDERLRMLEAALEHTRASACITDAELDAPGPRVLYVNPAYCAMTGRRREDVVGRTPRIMQGPLTDRRELDRLRDDLSHGRSFSGETVNYRADGSPFEISWRIDPIVDEAGTITNFVATQHDVTTLRRAERLLAAERLVDQALTEVLGSPSGTTEDVLAVAGSAVEAIAVLVPYGRAGVSLDVRTADGTRPIRAGAPVPTDVATDDLLTERRNGQGSVDLIRTLRFDDAAAAVGAVVVAGLRDWQLDAVDREGLDRLADRIPLVVDAALEYERRRAAALELQRALLPTIPDIEDVAVAARYVPVSFGADVGGDFYDVIHAHGRIFVVIGDVAGSGLRVAADMGRLALVMRLELGRHGDATLALAAADDLCVEEGLFATAAVAELDPTAGSLTFRSAGHPPAIVRRHGASAVVAATIGPPLGAGVRGWPEIETPFDAGTTVALFTDGLVERRDLDVVDGTDMLAGSLARAPEALEAACDHVVSELTSMRAPADDFAIVLAVNRSLRATSGT